MTERQGLNPLTGKDLFLNYINHGGFLPEVNAQNSRDAQEAVDAALFGHRSFRQSQLDELRRIIGVTQRRISDPSFLKRRGSVLGLLRRYPAWALRMHAVGDCLDSVLAPRPLAKDLVDLLQEASTLSMRRQRSGPAGTRTQNQ